MVNNSRWLVSAVTAASFASCFTSPVIGHASVQDGPPEAGNAVLGFDGDDRLANEFTALLRAELNRRRRGSDAEMSLTDLRLAMGCEDHDVNCLAEGGETLGVASLLFGTIAQDAKGYTIEIKRVDVATRALDTTVSRSFTTLDAAAAKSLADALFVPQAPRPLESDPAIDPAPSVGLYFGLEDNTPTWKWVGMGASGALMLVSLGTAVATSLALRPDGRLHTDLVNAARDSPNDANPANDINPDANANLCQLARVEIRPDEVTNGAMTVICNKTDTYTTLRNTAWVGTAVFATSSLIFGTLLLLHRHKQSESGLAGRDFQLGGAPTPDGGFLIQSAFRF